MFQMLSMKEPNDSNVYTAQVMRAMKKSAGRLQEDQVKTSKKIKKKEEEDS